MSWANVKGHEQLAASFQQVVRRDRLAHAYLFVGPEGVGKRRVAVELAKALLCEDSQARSRIDACDRCPACVQVGAATHPDFQYAELPEDKHEFPIEIVQDLIAHLALKPARGSYRVAIVNDADWFNEEAANCFLKTLEEPPPKSLLILLGTNGDRQLPTIRSRCQLIRFASPPEDVMVAQLRDEGLVTVADEGRRLIRLAGGDLADARLLAQPATAAFRRELIDSLSQARFDSVGMGQKFAKFADEGSKESAIKRQRAALGLKFLIEFIRAALVAAEGAEPALADPQDAAAVRRLAERVSHDGLLRMLDRCLEADYQVVRRLHLELILLSVMDDLGEAA